MPVQTPDIFGNYLAGKQARQQEGYANTRNALAEMDLQNAPQEMADRNALRGQQVQAGQMGIDQARAQQGYARLRQALDSGNPRQYVLEREPDLAAKLREHGVDLATVDDQTAMQVLDGFAREYAGKAGMTPAAPESFTLKPGESRYHGSTVVASQPAKPDKQDKPTSRFRALTPQEIQQANLPAGSSAQVDLDTGKIDVLSKRDNTGVLSQKDATTARNKLTILKVARKQLDSLKNTFTEGRAGAMNAFGPGQGVLPTQAGKKFDAALAQIRGTFTGIKRVPGVGSMSDYESKLDAAQFPDRNDYESVIEQKLQGMEDQLALLENGYTDLLSGGQQEQPAQAPARQQAGADIQSLLDKYAPQ